MSDREDWMNDLLASMLAWLQRVQPRAAEIVDFDEINDGGCPTCGHDSVEITIYYKDQDGNHAAFEHSGSFTEFIKELGGW